MRLSRLLVVMLVSGTIGFFTTFGAADVVKKLHVSPSQAGDWAKAHPKAKPGSGPFPWTSTVTVSRDGAQVPQLLRVKFADGSSEDVKWNDDRRWARFVFTKPAKVISAALDPEQKVYLDSNKLNDSLTTKADGTASRRWSADVASLLQTFYALVGSL